MSKARNIFRDKQTLADGGIIEMVGWEVRSPVPGSAHGLKYRLFYGYPGRRVVAYDNEAGKGDHIHYGDSEVPYKFTSVEDLIRDFIADVRRARGE